MSIEVRDNREDPAVSARTVLGITLGFTAAAGLIAFGLHFVFRHYVDPAKVEQPVATFPIPQIQPNPQQDYLGFRRRQNEQLAGYAWVDRGKDLIHVPIARAMALVAAKGDAGWDPPDPAPYDPTQTGRPPDGAPRAAASLPASPYGTRP